MTMPLSPDMEAALAEERRRFGGMPHGGGLSPMAPPSPPGQPPPSTITPEQVNAIRANAGAAPIGPPAPPAPPPERPESVPPMLARPEEPPPQRAPAVAAPSGVYGGPGAQDRAAMKLGLVPMPKPLVAAADRAERGVREAEDTLERRQERAAALEGAQRDVVADDLGAMQARHAERIAQQQAKERAALDHVDRLSADVRGMKADPNRYYEKSGTGGRIFAALAMGLGAYSAAINKTPNFAMDIINRGIDDDIAAQRFNIENARAGVENAKGLYAQLRQKGLDDSAAEAGAKAAYLEHAQAKLDAMAAGNKSGDMAARYDLLSRSLDQAKVAARQDAARALARETFVQQQQMSAEARAAQDKAYSRGVEAYKLGQEDRKIDIEGVKAQNQGVRDRAEAYKEGRTERSLVVPLPSGGYARARSETDAREYRNKFGAWKSIDGNIQRAGQIREGMPAWEKAAAATMPRETAEKMLPTYRKLASLEATTMQEVTVAQGQGAMSEGDARVARTAIGGMTSFGPGSGDALRAARETYARQFDEYAKSQLPDETDAAGAPIMKPSIQLGPVK